MIATPNALPSTGAGRRERAKPLAATHVPLASQIALYSLLWPVLDGSKPA